MKWLMFWKRCKTSVLDEALFAGIARAERRRIVKAIEAQAPKGLPAVERFEIKLGLLLDHLPAEWKTDIRRRADEVARTAGAGLNLPTLAHLTARPANDDFVLAPREPRQVLSDLLVGVAAEPR